MSVMSLRLNAEEKRHILKWAKKEGKDQSQAARELLEYGWKFTLLESYREKKISLGRLAEELNVSASEAMDFLARHGIQSTVDYADYLEGLENLRTA